MGRLLSFDRYCPVFACFVGGVLRSYCLMGLALAMSMWSSCFQNFLPRSCSDNEDIHCFVSVTAQRLLGFSSSVNCSARRFHSSLSGPVSVSPWFSSPRWVLSTSHSEQCGSAQGNSATLVPGLATTTTVLSTDTFYHKRLGFVRAQRFSLLQKLKFFQ